MLYAQDASALRREVMDDERVAGTIERCWSRPTNLEDVFLAVTGTTLREGP